MATFLDLSRFFAVDVNPGAALPATYDPLLVAASFFVAALAGFAFIHLLHRITEQAPSAACVGWMIGGAMTMGLGIWAMHFLGMLAYRLPISVAYDPVVTALSAVPAVLASAWNLHVVARPRVTQLRLVVGGVILGGGIGAMHYTGMAAIEFNAFVRYDPWLFAASILVAVILAMAALAAAYWMARRGPAATLASELVSALLIGLAVAGMHYTAMSSTLCFASPDPSAGVLNIDPDMLAVATTVVATLVLLAAIAAVVFDRRLASVTLQREQAARLARETDRRLTEAVETMPGSLALFGADDTLILCNSQFREEYGWTDGLPDGPVTFQDVIGRHLGERVAEERGDGLDGPLAESLRQGRHRSTPVLLEAPNGTWSLVRQRRTGDGGTVFLKTDVTAIKQAEELLKRQEMRLKLIMDNVADAVVTLDRDGHLESFNRAAERIFGYAAGEVTGWHVSTLMADDVQDPDLLDRHLARRGGRGPEGDGLEIVGRHRNGGHIYLEAVFSEVSERGRTVFVGALRDITERKLNATALRRAKEEAERANQAKTEFISHMSHELRTPLNAVIGLTQALRQTEALRADPEKLIEYLADIHASGEHLLALVNDVLDLSTIEGGGRAIQAETFETVEEIEAVIRPLRSAERGRRASLEVAAAAPLTVTADRQSFRQVMLNLAGNALDHGGADVTVRIEVDQAEADGYACVRVSDDGPGIPDELAVAIGQPFPQVRTPYVRPGEVARNGGTGLGLFIVTQLMALNGGRVELASTPGRGTTVTTYWPRPASQRAAE